DYRSIRDDADALSGVAAHAFGRGILSTGDTPGLVTGETITPNYFEVLGLRPALGRVLREDENVGEGQHPVMVISHGLWQRRFGGGGDNIRQAGELRGVKYTPGGGRTPGVSGVGARVAAPVSVPSSMGERPRF